MRRLVCAGAALAMAAGCSSDAKPKQPIACADIAALNSSLNEISDNLSGGKELFATMHRQATALATHAPDSLRADAHALQQAIARAKVIVDATTSMSQLQHLEQSDPRVQEAVSDMLSSVQTIATWRTDHC